MHRKAGPLMGRWLLIGHLRRIWPRQAAGLTFAVGRQGLWRVQRGRGITLTAPPAASEDMVPDTGMNPMRLVRPTVHGCANLGAL